MDDSINNGDKSAGQAEHKTFDWQHVWKSVEDTGKQAGTAIKQHVSQIDTKELGDKAKHAANEGLKVARGQSDNRQANEISDAASKWIPGAGLIRKGAEIAHETGADGKVLEGKTGPLHAPSNRTLTDVGKEAIGTAIPIPGGGILAHEILNRSGVKDKIMSAAMEAAQNHSSASVGENRESPFSNRAKNNYQETEYPPKLVIDDSKAPSAAREQMGKLLHMFQRPETLDANKK